jgi:hypothetical protein
MSPAKATENALKRQLPMQINPLQSYQDQLASMGPNAKRPMVSGTSTYVVPASSHCITLPQMANGQPTTMNIPMMSIPTAFLQQPQQQSTIAASHAAAVAAQNGGLSTSTVSTSAPQMAGSYALSGASPGSVPGMPVLNGNPAVSSLTPQQQWQLAALHQQQQQMKVGGPLNHVQQAMFQQAKQAQAVRDAQMLQQQQRHTLAQQQAQQHAVAQQQQAQQQQQRLAAPVPTSQGITAQEYYLTQRQLTDYANLLRLQQQMPQNSTPVSPNHLILQQQQQAMLQAAAAQQQEQRRRIAIGNPMVAPSQSPMMSAPLGPQLAAISVAAHQREQHQRNAAAAAAAAASSFNGKLTLPTTSTNSVPPTPMMSLSMPMAINGVESNASESAPPAHVSMGPDDARFQNFLASVRHIQQQLVAANARAQQLASPHNGNVPRAPSENGILSTHHHNNNNTSSTPGGCSSEPLIVAHETD